MISRVAKFSKTARLSPEKRTQLIYSFCRAIHSLKTDSEIAKFITDLLSPQEAEMLAKRLQIAELLLKGYDYKLIKDKLRVGNSTISRISTWLSFSGDGFKLVASRNPDNSNKNTKNQNPIKLKYSQYYLPERIINQIINNIDQKNKQKVLTILQSMVIKRSAWKLRL